ncbi:hypothetical protein Ae505Ps2_0291c [Pseudonocardia sp. Ae505_Ps2]|nr:hypothetical protein Ae505Ps2_0291c [Pseudonocardia sp. Ae505_Ps2]
MPDLGFDDRFVRSCGANGGVHGVGRERPADDRAATRGRVNGESPEAARRARSRSFRRANALVRWVRAPDVV